MTMLSFRVDEDQATRAQEWAEELGIDRSELLRQALRRHLDVMAARREADTWTNERDDREAVEALASIADWGPDEDWSDWHDAAG
jgi:antitoxin component of RelBE/YafQ-DinJ toxin-antitoxin module